MKYICGTCKHYDSDLYFCVLTGEFDMYEEETCDDWESENELTKEEEDEIIGDMEAHRRMVED